MQRPFRFRLAVTALVVAASTALVGCGGSGSSTKPSTVAQQQAARLRALQRLEVLQEATTKEELQAKAAAAEQALADAKAAANASPTVTTVTAVVTTPAPVAAPATGSDDRIPESGHYSGDASQSAHQGKPARAYPVSMTFSGTGSTVDYPSLGCSGTLVPSGFDGGARVYDEHLSRGHCNGGGTWRVRVSSANDLFAVWSAPSEAYTVAVELTS